MRKQKREREKKGVKGIPSTEVYAAVFLSFRIRLITHAGIAAGVGRAFSRVCLSVCPRFNRKTAWAINTKVGTSALARHALIQRSKSQRSRSHGFENRHGRTVASDNVPYSASIRCSATCVGLPMFSSFMNVFFFYLTWAKNVYLRSRQTKPRKAKT